MHLPLETMAIVRATMPDVAHGQAAITLRMWHHLPQDFQRDLLFVSCDSTGPGHTLLGALLASLQRQDGARMVFIHPFMLANPHCAQEGLLEEALLRAIADVIGLRASDMVMHAWRQVLDAFFAESCRR